MTTHSRIATNIAVLTLDNPPVNGLGLDTRAALAAGVERALADPAVAGIVIQGAGKVFCGGADIREFDSPKMLAEPNLHQLIAQRFVARFGGAIADQFPNTPPCHWWRYAGSCTRQPHARRSWCGNC